MTTIAILYEDERGSVKDYPLHTLVCACIADRSNRPIADVQGSLRAVPKKGDSKLLEACRQEVERMRETTIFALFDADGLARLLRKPGDTPLPELHGALASSFPEGRPRIYVLERKTETVVEATADCLERPRPQTKNKIERDKLLAIGAWGSREARACIRERVPSFAAFVDAVADALLETKQ
jgi:hypothetical protein